MPAYLPTLWGVITPGDTVLGRDGRARLIRGRPAPHLVTTLEGTFPVDPYGPCLLVRASSETEALMIIIQAFPGVLPVTS